MASEGVACRMCGAEMREVLGQRATTHGVTERTWQCPACLHLEVRRERARGRDATPATV